MTNTQNTTTTKENVNVNEVNMTSIITELQATISSLRVELDTMKLNSTPKFNPSDFQSKSMKELFDTESLSYVSKNFNSGLNSFRKVADYLKLNNLSDLTPMFKEKSGGALNIINDTLKYLGQEKIKPVKLEKKV
jgi:hypothetical protein